MLIMYDIGLEFSLVGYIMSTGKFVDINKSHFYSESAREIYCLLEKQYLSTGKCESQALPDKYIEVISKAKESHFPKEIKPVIAQIGKYHRLREADKLFKMQLQAICSEVDIDSIISYTSKRLAEVSNCEIDENYQHDKELASWATKIYNSRDDDSLMGYHSHLELLDQKINGWQRGCFYIIGGLKKTGKSRFAINLGSVWSKNNIPVLYVSMEMGRDKINQCVMSSRLNINTNKYGTSKISQNELMQITKELPNYQKENVYISTKSGATIEYIRGLIHRQKANGGAGVVIVDYIQRMKAEGKESRTKEVEHCAIGLADLARDENVIMIALSQLSGEAEKKRKDAPVYSYVKESQAIIEAADCAMFLVDKKRGKESENHDFKVLGLVLLQRDGESDIYIPLKAELQYSKFSVIGKDELDSYGF